MNTGLEAAFAVQSKHGIIECRQISFILLDNKKTKINTNIHSSSEFLELICNSCHQWDASQFPLKLALQLQPKPNLYYRKAKMDQFIQPEHHSLNSECLTKQLWPVAVWSGSLPYEEKGHWQLHILYQGPRSLECIPFPWFKITSIWCTFRHAAKAIFFMRWGWEHGAFGGKKLFWNVFSRQLAERSSYVHVVTEGFWLTN